MPCKIIAFTAHNWLTKRDYTYSLDDMCDIGIATCVAIWVYLIEAWSQLPKPEDPNLAATVTGDFENYCYWFILKNYEHSFRFLVFLAVMITFIWVRFLLMLQLTKSFGPMLRIILTMIGEMIKFLVIYGIILITFSGVSSLLFGDLAEFQDFTHIFFVNFGYGLANYDFSIFGIAGKLFVVFALLLNAITMINFVIAILAYTFTALQSSSLGLYYDGVISRIPVYEDDSRYGGLIVGIPPFNILALVMIPFYALITNEDQLRRMNDFFTKAMFLPIALGYTALFMAVNLLLLPFAYLAAIVKKIKLLTLKAKVDMVVDLIMFVLAGVPLLLLA